MSTRSSSVALLGRRPGLTAALGAGCIAFSAILVRLSQVSPDTAAVFRCLYALPALGLLAWRERRRYGPAGRRDRRVALAAGVFFALDLIAWHRSIEAVGAGLATVLGNLQVVLVGLVAWRLLGERPSNRLLVAVPVVVAGIVLISGVLEEGAYGEDPVAGTVFGILTAVAYTGFVLLLRRANADLRRPAGPLFDATLAATVVTLAAGLALGDLDLVPGLPAQGWLVLLALTSQVAGWLLISISLPRLPAAVTSVVITLQPVGSVFLAVLLLVEAPSAVQFAGVALVLAGVMTAARAQRRVPIPEPAG
ncbi:MAG: DMT family transporter [Actinomycetota bacterium]|nr:DMT family transporter [Actinomycetota bacterium]